MSRKYEEDPYAFDFDFSKNSSKSRHGPGSLPSEKAKDRTGFNRSIRQDGESTPMSALDRAGYYLKKYSTKEISQKSRTEQYKQHSTEEDEDSDRWLDPEHNAYSQGDSEDLDLADSQSESASTSLVNTPRGLTRTDGKIGGLHLDGPKYLDTQKSGLESDASFSEHGGSLGLGELESISFNRFGAPWQPSEPLSPDSAQSPLSSQRKSLVRSQTKDESIRWQRKIENDRYQYRSFSNDSDEIKFDEDEDDLEDEVGEENSDLDSDSDYEAALKEIQREEEARRREALRMMQDAKSMAEHFDEPNPFASQQYKPSRSQVKFEDNELESDATEEEESYTRDSELARSGRSPGQIREDAEDNEDDEDDEDEDYEQAMQLLEEEEAQRRKEALRMLQEANAAGGGASGLSNSEETLQNKLSSTLVKERRSSNASFLSNDTSGNKAHDNGKMSGHKQDNESLEDEGDEYLHAMKELKEEEERQKQEALSTLTSTSLMPKNYSTHPRVPGGVLRESKAKGLHVVIQDSTYHAQRVQVKGVEVDEEDKDEEFNGMEDEDTFVEDGFVLDSARQTLSARDGSAVQTVYSSFAEDASESMADLMSPRSVKSRVSARSLRSTFSAKSPKSIRSLRSRRTHLSLGRQSSAESSFDEYSADDFESENGSPRSARSGRSIRSSRSQLSVRHDHHSPQKPRSSRSHPASPRSPPLSSITNRSHLIAQHAKITSSHPENSSAPTENHPAQNQEHKASPQLPMRDASTQYIETKEIEVQANLVVSASGLVYEVPEAPIGAVAPTLFPSKIESNIANAARNPTSTCSCHASRFEDQNNFARSALEALLNPLNTTYTSTHAQALRGPWASSIPVQSANTNFRNVYADETPAPTGKMPFPANQATPPPMPPSPRQQPPETSCQGVSRLDGLTASLLATNNMFKRNLEMIRSHLQECRLETDRVMSEMGGINSGHRYTRFSDVRAYMNANRPKVRSFEYVMQEEENTFH